MNPNIYTDPTKWDPGRFLPGRAEDKKVSAHGFVGWGSGRHPCREYSNAANAPSACLLMIVFGSGDEGKRGSYD